MERFNAFQDGAKSAHPLQKTREWSSRKVQGVDSEGWATGLRFFMLKGVGA
jgi:hypothetical protein